MSLIAAACGSDKNNEATGSSTTGAASGGNVAVKNGGTVAYAAEQEPAGFNNLTSKDNLAELRHIMRHVWPYAYYSKPDFSVVPTETLAGPAKVVSSQPFTVQWDINPKAVWSDGVPVTTDDFQWTYESCNNKVDPGEASTPNPKTGVQETALDCASTAGYDKVTKFDKISDKSFKMEFSEPYVEYEGLFGDPIPPAHIGRTLPGGWNTGFDADPKVSAGPFLFKEWVKGDHITLVKNPKWWGPAPHLDSLVYREIPDPATHPAALQNNEVQMIYPQPQTDLLDQVKQLQGVKYDLNFGPTWEHLDFNFKNPLLADLAVRKAIAYSLDRQRYVDTLMKPFSDKASVLQNRVFMSNQPEYVDHGKEYAKQDIAKATAALEAAGYTKGADGIYAKGGQRLSFRLRVKSPNPLREQMEQLMQADLQKAGIEAKIVNFSTPDTIGSIGSKGDFDLFIFAWVGTPFEVSGAQQTFDSSSDSNFGKYSNEKVDAQIKQAGTILNQKDRADALNKADEMMWEDLPNIPLFQKPVGLLAFSDKYGNITDNTTTEGPFWNSLNWGLKAAAS
ncbi:MAG TPA: ABC transporter family substrate-binding protein [Acidimicrobiales bacterium]|nr:ABC transporter family substrate-binding protein [Acidimicrobiales bacterium]